MLNSLFDGQSQASWLSPSKRFVCQLCWEIYFPYDEPREAASFPTELLQSSPRRAHRIFNGVSERITPHTSLAAGLEESPGENGCSERMKLEEWNGFFLFHFLIPCANRETFQPLYGCLIDWEGHLLFTSQWSWLKEGISHLIRNPASVCQSEVYLLHLKNWFFCLVFMNQLRETIEFLNWSTVEYWVNIYRSGRLGGTIILKKSNRQASWTHLFCSSDWLQPSPAKGVFSK